MKNKKVLALLVSLVMIVAVALPGTLAVSSDQDTADSEFTVANEPVTSTPETTPDASPAPETASPAPETQELTGGQEQAVAPEIPEPVLTCTCDPAPLEGEEHKEGCPLTCTCVSQPLTGTIHKEGCPLYVAPLTCTCDPQPAEGEAHKEGCPLYVEPVEEFDAVTAKEKLFASENIEVAEAYLSSLTEEQLNAVMNLFTEAEIKELARKFGIDTETVIITPPVNYMAVGPLMDAVQTAAPRSFMRSFSSTEQEEKNGLILDKTVKYNPNTNKITITLEAYTTGTVTTSAHAVPVDVVMVLDESGSMTDKMQSFKKVYQLDTKKTYYVKSEDSYVQVKWCNSMGHDKGWYSGFHFFIWHIGTNFNPMTSETDTNSGHVQFYEDIGSQITKQQALISAVTDFADKVYQNAVDNNVDHRISLIGFSGDGASRIMVGLEADIRDNVQNVKSAAAGLNANGGTFIEDGLANAKSVFDNATPTSTTERKRVVIVFTDGIPGTGDWDDSQTAESARAAISTAYSLKQTYGATVYTIGMLTDANPELAISDNDSDSAKTNKFLHYVSSNYPNAQSMSNGGSGGNSGYYLSASDIGSLNAIFTKISEEIATPGIQLDAEAQIRDIITPQFTVPTGANEIRLYTDNYNGTAFENNRAAADGVTAQILNDTITVQGFNFNDNFVSERVKQDGTHGKKLIIEFEVETKEGFLGGNDVYTNGEASGVYDKEGNSIEKFPLRTVNVPIKDVAVTAPDKNVYLLGGVTLDDLKKGTTVTVGGSIELNLSKANDTEKPYGLDPWQTAYVNIIVEYKDGDKVLTELTDLKDDVTYTVEVTVEPRNPNPVSTEGTKAEAKTGSAKGKINVFKPVLTYKDSEAYYGDVAPTDYSGNLVSTKWKHDETRSTAVDMIGTAPELTKEYTPEAGKISTDNKINSKQDIGVDVTVKINNEDVTGHVKFEHTNCTGKTCNLPEGKEFLIHVKTCTLTITKTGGAAGDPYVFEVKKDGQPYTEVTVKSGESVEIVELPVGTYTITEKTDWSWRYTPSYSNDGKAELAASAPNGKIICTNTSNTDKWLNDYAVKSNTYQTGTPATDGNN